jgi:phospholipid/cholesterol/gamma-HCH transport system substrate-binding protein
MKPTLNYVLVGLFVLAGVATFLWLVFWLVGAGRIVAERPVDLVFRESVYGLQPGSMVQFMGINVGEVASVRLLSTDPPLVQVRVHIRRDTPVGPGTRGSIEYEFITGVTFVTLEHRPQEPAVYHAVDSGVEEIATVPNNLMAALDQLPQITAEATELLTRAGRLLSDDNLNRVADILSAVDSVTAAVAGRSEQIERALQQGADAAGHVRGAVEALEQLVEQVAPHLESGAEQFAATVSSAEQVAAALQEWLQRHEAPLDEFVERGLGQAGEVMEDLQRTLRELERLGRRLGEDPSRIIYRETEDAIELPP